MCGLFSLHNRFWKKNEVEFNNIPIMREFSNVFPKELSGLPLEREVEVSIDILLSISPTAWAPAELVELKVQLQKLIQRGFIHPSSLPWRALVLFFYFFKKKMGHLGSAWTIDS